MPAPTPSSRRYATGAWLDFTTLTLMVDTEIVRASLACSPRLDLVPIAGAPPGKHPISIDLSRVRDGRPEPGGLDQHAWSEAVGAAAGAGYGALTGAFFGPIGAAWGASMGAAIGRNAARDVSERAARTVGTYNEAMAFVPNVAVDGAGQYLFSLGMHTDSPLSKRLSEIFRSGFGKRMALIDCRGFSSYDVFTQAGAMLLSARFSAAEFVPLKEAPDLSSVIGWLSQPVLGHLGDGVLAVAHVDRFYDDPAVRVAPVSGSVVIERGFLPGVPAGAWEIGRDEGEIGLPLSPSVTAFQATYVPVRLDFPSAVR